MPAICGGLQSLWHHLCGAALFSANVPPWFVGVAFAAHRPSARVWPADPCPSHRHLFTRNIYMNILNPNCTPECECQVGEICRPCSDGAQLVFIAAAPSLAVQLQLLGGSWIIQTRPASCLGLYTLLPSLVGCWAGWAQALLPARALLRASISKVRFSR